MNRSSDPAVDAGFTLVEMLVVLAIIALGTGAIALAIRQDSDREVVKKAAELVGSTFALARLDAMRDGTRRDVRIDLADRQIGPLAGGSSGRLDKRLSVVVKTGRELLSAGDTETVFVFLPDGSSSGGFIVLRLGDEKRTVQVNWLTGIVRMQ